VPRGEAGDLALAVLTQWSPRRRLARASFWPAVATLVLAAAGLERLLAWVVPGSAARGPVMVALAIYVAVLLVKCTAWRYRDAGFRWWWSLIQAAILVPSVILIVRAGITALASFFGMPVPSRSLIMAGGYSFFLVVPGLALWWAAWCCPPSTSRFSDEPTTREAVEIDPHP
jgi:hypothetical protein